MTSTGSLGRAVCNLLDVWVAASCCSLMCLRRISNGSQRFRIVSARGFLFKPLMTCFPLWRRNCNDCFMDELCKPSNTSAASRIGFRKPGKRWYSGILWYLPTLKWVLTDFLLVHDRAYFTQTSKQKKEDEIIALTAESCSIVSGYSFHVVCCSMP